MYIYACEDVCEADGAVRMAGDDPPRRAVHAVVDAEAAQLCVEDCARVGVAKVGEAYAAVSACRKELEVGQVQSCHVARVSCEGFSVRTCAEVEANNGRVV